MTESWKGSAGFAYTGDNSSTAASKVYPLAESIDPKDEPEVYEHEPAQTPDVLDIKRAGFNHSIQTSGMRASCHDLAYFLWLALGGQAYTSLHTLTPANDPLFFNYKVDRKLDLGSGNTTAEYVGCKIGNWTLEQPLRGYASLDFQTLACAKASPSATLSVTPPNDANSKPLDWSTLAAGFLKIGYAGATPAQDNTIQSFKISGERTLKPSGYLINTSQPSAMNSGRRKLMVEITREFSGAAAATEYAVWAANADVELDVKWIVGSHYIRLNFPKMKITGSYGGPIGTSEDSIMATLVCTATKPDGGVVMTAEAVDSTLALFT